jgi:hypothetical protein
MTWNWFANDIAVAESGLRGKGGRDGRRTSAWRNAGASGGRHVARATRRLVSRNCCGEKKTSRNKRWRRFRAPLHHGGGE